MNCDSVIVLKLSGALLGTEGDCLFWSTYVPPCGSRFYESAESNCLIAEAEQCICELLERFGDVKLICNGHFNARTATYQVNQAFAQNCGFEDDVTDTTVIWENSRISQDSNINDFDRKLLELCIFFDLLLVNGCPPWDNVGKLIYVSQRGNSVVGYFLMSSAVTSCVQKITVENSIE